MKALATRRRGEAQPVSVPDARPVVGPDSVQITPRHLVVGEAFAASFAVTGYPAEVHAGWLEPLLTYPGRLDVAMHVDPIDPVTASTKLRRQRARLESTRRADAEKGRLGDPEAEAAAQDAADLAYRLARGEGKLFTVGLYLTVYADSEDALAREVAAVRALASSLLVATSATTFRALQGWTTCLPLGIDAIGATRTFDTGALAAAFPFTSPDLAGPDPADTAPASGVLYGVNAASSGLVLWDRWAQDNHNSITLARSGAGKSYLTKLDVLRSLYTGVQVFVVDPENEYTRLASAVGGSVLSMGSTGVRLNPFDLPAHAAQQQRPGAGNALTRRALFIQTFISVLLGCELSALQRAALDKAVLAAYAAVGILAADPRTWTRPAPVLPNLIDALVEVGSEPAVDLAANLEPYVTGSYSGLFDGPTSTAPAGHLVVFSLRELPDELKTVGTLLVLDAIWQQVTSGPRARRLVVVDEMWLLMRDPSGAKFLLRMAKAARKLWAGLAVITQDAADVLGSDLGAAIVANSATQVLLRQAPQALPAVAKAFRLSDGETALIASASQGLGLLAAGNSRVSFQVIASDTEHQLCSSSPADALDDDGDGYFDHTTDPDDEPLYLSDVDDQLLLDDPEGDLL
ncbi:VirB4 family type IV secretion system protein [Catenulispora rubra]|uniref:VirB4 family type IV secretion system protein n=1 Tax=Catenulispora rubra TaxID=280293 RepID=UPI00189212A1|nr:conjugal transfer protein TraC [Catenulispora rubra]